MNLLIEKGVITEMACGSNLAYLLDNSTSFLPTEYKVLQSQSNSCFVKCMKMLYNGKIQLYYLTDGYRPLTGMFPNLDAERFLTITANLLTDIIEVKNNGFLSCQNVDISFEHLYVDPATYKVSLIYLPLDHRMFEDYSIFENELRTSLVKLISGLPALSTPRTVRFSSDLSNGVLTLEDLRSRLKGNSGGGSPNGEANSPLTRKTELSSDHIRIVSLNAPSRMEISVTKDDFILGRKAGAADGVLSFNDKIGRVHCKIIRNGGRWMILDLNSKNGTYLNRIRLQPEQPYPIKNGDVLRLANSDFQIEMR